MVVVAYLDSDGIERTYEVGSEPILIGREAGCAIHSNDGLVSRRHAQMYVNPTGVLMVEDLGSANGVFVGANRVKTAQIPLGAVVVIGSLRLRRLAAPPIEKSQPPAPVQEVLARRPTYAVLEPIRAAPSAPAAPGADVHAMLSHLLESERVARRALETERDGQLAQLNYLQHQLAAAHARIAELERYIWSLHNPQR